MVVAIHLVKGLDSHKVSKVIDLNREAVNDTRLSTPKIKTEMPSAVKRAHFLKDFEAVVYTEMQKSLDCIELIKQDINNYRIESQVLRKQWYLETSADERERISNKIAVNQQWVVECEEHISLMNQRALRLQDQLEALFLQDQRVNQVVQA